MKKQIEELRKQNLELLEANAKAFDDIYKSFGILFEVMQDMADKLEENEKKC